MIFNKLNLRSKFILIFLLIGLIPVTILAAIAFVAANNVLHAEIETKFNIFTAEKENLLETWFENQQKTISIVASVQDIYENLNLYYIFRGTGEWLYQNETVVLTLLERIKNEKNFRDLFITNLDGVIISTTNEALLDQNVAHRDYIQRSLSGQVTTSEIYYSDLVESNIIVISAPIYRDYTNRDIIGVICGFYDSNQITEMTLDGLDNIGKSADSFLINGNGLILTLPKDARGMEVLNTRIDNVA
ncbi:MAG TPA: hypothetical protein VIK74_00960, partial [Parasegetibacter sp.]